MQTKFVQSQMQALSEQLADMSQMAESSTNSIEVPNKGDSRPDLVRAARNTSNFDLSELAFHQTSSIAILNTRNRLLVPGSSHGSIGGVKPKERGGAIVRQPSAYSRHSLVHHLSLLRFP
jgi:hypothetical protein